jgi:hypothetical protein
VWKIPVFLIGTTILGISVVLMFPKIDLENAPIDFFYFDHGNAFEITVVFKDEDHPNKFLDPLYDLYRLMKWGRIKDIETFYIYRDKVVFPDDYASVTSFYQTKNLRTHAEIPLDEFQKFDGKIAVYVNTWNHMFSNKPLPGLEYVPFIFKPKIGTRSDAEKIYSIYK